MAGIFEFFIDILEFIKKLNDVAIFGFIDTVKSDYSVIAVVVLIVLGRPILWCLKKLAVLTPWTSDDRSVTFLESRMAAIEERVGLPKE